MNSENIFNQFMRQFNETFLPNAQALSSEVQQHLRSAMMSAFDKMDLVSREEFDAQRAVLARAREKLDSLEIQLADLEKEILNQKGQKEKS